MFRGVETDNALSRVATELGEINVIKVNEVNVANKEVDAVKKRIKRIS